MCRMLLAVSLAALACAAPSQSALRADVAALQVGLRAQGAYRGAVDGIPGPATGRAVRAFQRRAGLAVDGVAGPATRAALRRKAPGWSWSVAALQFSLALHGFPCGPLDGRPGPRTQAAVRRFQRHAGLAADGIAGPATLAALRRPPPVVPIALRAPLVAPRTDGFGPRGNRFHTGLDLAAPAGTPVRAAAAGTVAFAGALGGGWGVVVTIAHGAGVRTMYAHLARTDVRVGDRVRGGDRVGRVGATGRTTGPHLHFEVRVRGAAVDPASALSR